MDALLGNFSLADLAARKSYKWRCYPPDVLPAFVAEMDFMVAEPIAAAVRAALEVGDTGYPDPGDLGEAFGGFAAERLGWTIKPEWVFPIPDVMTGIAEILQAVTPDGSGVVINPPVYGPFYLRLGYMNRQVVDAPLHRAADGSYDLDFEVLDQALARPDVSAYLLCSPHNPLGNVWRRDQLLTIADLAARHQVVLLVDEIHAPLALADARHVPFASLDHPMAQRAYTFNSASKGWNIAGLKCGIAVASSQAMADLLTDRWEALLASHFGVLASIAAFSEAVDWLDAVRLQLVENRQLLARLLREQLPEVGYVPGAASFLAWLDCRQLDLGDDPAEAFLERGRVALTGGPYFGAQGKGFARLNIGTSPELVTEAVRRMAAAVA
ncbi:MAG TPA: aminotransferase class I/II-fold pyridoxal phosphate-dependent enzyme [Streptosporangiaceae bacterium]|jgi:cystathionine beta-lyase|nr:aminotransferase class I/II-fold pyridoxal phosphate-dependent enzyme [Streptosporangiaceae bacterium]